MSSERQLLETLSPWWGEHLHRYEEVISNLTGNENILDIACGTGFGSNVLATKTSGDVIGGDISSEVIAENKKSCDKHNLKFEVLDGTAFTLPRQHL